MKSKPKATNRSHWERVQRQARICLNRGWGIVAIRRGQKRPVIKGWPTSKLSLNELQDAFAADDGIGVILGDVSGGLVDVDVDAEEGLTAAGIFLPETDRGHGRKSKIVSHRLYLVNPSPAKEQFADVDSTMLIEIRSTGQQTLIPPTVHPTGERIRWEATGDPGCVDAETLRRAVRKVAAVAILARHWASKGQRHECSKALCGVLLRAGWSEDEVIDFLEHASKGSGRDDEWATRKSDVRTTVKRLAQERPATGLPRLRGILGDDVVTKLVEWLGLSPETIQVTSTFEKFTATLPQWPDPPSDEAFYGLAGEIVAAIEPHSEADPVALLAQALTCLGSAAGRNAFFQVESDCHFTNLFTVLVGESAKARKGLSWANILDLYRRASPTWAEHCVKSGLSTGEGLVWEVRDQVTRLEFAKKGSLTLHETVVLDEGAEDKRLLAQESEFAQLLKLMSRHASILSTVLRQAYDSGNLRTMTKNNPGKATGAHISVVGHITQDELRRYLTETEQANGFGNRFLWFSVRRSKKLPDGGHISDDVKEQLATKLAEALKFAQSVKEMKRSAKATMLWHDVYGNLSEGKPGLLGSMISRAEAQVTRLSLIYALMDCSPEIRSQHLRAALALWKYVESSARFIFGEQLGDRHADEILAALRTAGSQGLTRTEISNLFQRHLNAALITRALSTLARHGKAICHTEQTDGRPEQRWLAVEFAAKKAK